MLIATGSRMNYRSYEQGCSYFDLNGSGPIPRDRTRSRHPGSPTLMLANAFAVVDRELESLIAAVPREVAKLLDHHAPRAAGKFKNRITVHRFDHHEDHGVVHHVRAVLHHSDVGYLVVAPDGVDD